MFELVYSSVAQKNLKPEDIQDILNTSRKFNREHDISGCLLYHNHQFTQLLEGEKMVIQELFSKIKEDKRHKNVVLISEEHVEKRMFKYWSMAYCCYDERSNDFKNYLFKKNFIALIELTEKPTHSTSLFFQAARQMLEDGFYSEQNVVNKM